MSLFGPGDFEQGRGVMRYVRTTTREVGDWEHGEVVLEGVGEVAPHLRGPGGGLWAGALLTMIDNVGGFCAGVAALPDAWVMSANITARVLRPAQAGPLRLRAWVLRRGKAAIVTAIEARDEGSGGALVADAMLTSATLVPEGGPPPWPRPVMLEPGPAPEPPVPTLPEWMGLQPVTDTAVEIEIGEELRNPWGILHGGVVAALADAAAEHAVARRCGRPAATTDMTLHFLAPARVGPVRATATVLGARPDGHVTRVELRDLGRDDRLVALAVVTVAEVTPTAEFGHPRA